jgi:small-conductance mechanosensitive channel
MNVPLVIGGVGLVGGLAVGVLTERLTHTSNEAEKADIQARTSEWLAGANGHFSDEIEADRLRNRDLDARIEDYELQHPKPGELHWGRDEAGYPTSVDLPTRDNYFLGTVGGGLGGGLLGGGMVYAIASESSGRGAVVGSAVGAGIIGAGVGLAAGSIISNWTH